MGIPKGPGVQHLCLWSDSSCRWVWLTLTPSSPVYFPHCLPLSSSNCPLITHPLEKAPNTITAPPRAVVRSLCYSFSFLPTQRTVYCVWYMTDCMIFLPVDFKWIGVELQWIAGLYTVHFLFSVICFIHPWVYLPWTWTNSQMKVLAET